MLSSYYVDLLFRYLLYLAMSSLVCLVVNVVLVSQLTFLFGSVFVSISSFLVSCAFWSVSSLQCLPIGTLFVEENCVCPNFSHEFGVYPFLARFHVGPHLQPFCCAFSVYIFFYLRQMSKEWDEHLTWDRNVRTQWCSCFNYSPKMRLGTPALNEPM